MTFNVEEFVDMLRRTYTGNMLFNPYRDVCMTHDSLYSSNTRSFNLECLLEKIDQFDTILVGEAPGHMGCRRTGIAFTDEFTLEQAGEVYGVKFDKATMTDKIKERSATFVWDILGKLKNPPLMWNIIPFHPHEKDKSLSNRTPNRDDYDVSRIVINYFFKNTKFKRYIAIGRHAEKYLEQKGLRPIYIRHPSHGGSTKFKKGMYENFEVKDV